jgi:nitroreductase
VELRDVVRGRRMVRNYTGEPVDPEVVGRILDTARRAPSAGFSQGQSFVVVTAAEDRRKIAEICDEPTYRAMGFDPWISRAPVHVIPCVSPTAYIERYREPDKAGSTPAEEWDVPFWWVDGGAALMLLLLATVDEGLAAGFLSIDADAVREMLDIPPDVLPLGLVTLGHAAPDRRSGSLSRGRRVFEDVVHQDRWGGGAED